MVSSLSVVLSGFDVDRWLSIVDAAVSRIGIRFCIVWPLLMRHWMNRVVISINSSGVEFWFQYQSISPVISPFIQLCGCAESGGMYKYRLRGFWYVVVCILPSLIVIVRSREVLEVDGVSMFHLRFPKPYMAVVNCVQVVSLVSTHIPSTSSMISCRIGGYF